MRAAKVKLVRAALEEELLRILGADDCRHTSVQSDVFSPGIGNFLCACGMLVGYDFLDQAESPAHVLAAQLQRFPLLPLLIYFDTACQLARNTSRLIPSLINMSATATSVDRVHNTGHQHKCSDIFDADRYPSRSVTHTTSVAESRHAINKRFSAHLSHLRQDHFIVQMRLLAGIINARVIMRRTQRKETHHRLLCTFFHSNTQDVSERRVCSCLNWQWQENERISQKANGPTPGDAPGDGPGEGRAVDVQVAGDDAIEIPAGLIAGLPGVGAVSGDLVQHQVDGGAVAGAPVAGGIVPGERETRRLIAVVTTTLRSSRTAVEDDAQGSTQPDANVEEGIEDGSRNSDGADPRDGELAALVFASASDSDTAAAH